MCIFSISLWEVWTQFERGEVILPTVHPIVVFSGKKLKYHHGVGRKFMYFLLGRTDTCTSVHFITRGHVVG